jgi:hypothetical protein
MMPVRAAFVEFICQLRALSVATNSLPQVGHTPVATMRSARDAMPFHFPRPRRGVPQDAHPSCNSAKARRLEKNAAPTVTKPIVTPPKKKIGFQSSINPSAGRSHNRSHPATTPPHRPQLLNESNLSLSLLYTATTAARSARVMCAGFEAT